MKMDYFLLLVIIIPSICGLFLLSHKIDEYIEETSERTEQRFESIESRLKDIESNLEDEE